MREPTDRSVRAGTVTLRVHDRLVGMRADTDDTRRLVLERFDQWVDDHDIPWAFDLALNTKSASSENGAGESPSWPRPPPATQNRPARRRPLTATRRRHRRTRRRARWLRRRPPRTGPRVVRHAAVHAWRRCRAPRPPGTNAARRPGTPACRHHRASRMGGGGAPLARRIARSGFALTTRAVGNRRRSSPQLPARRHRQPRRPDQRAASRP